MIPLRKLGKNRRYVLLLVDILLVIISYVFCECFIRETLSFNQNEILQISKTTFIAVIVYAIVLASFRVYNNITRFEGGKDYLVYFFGCMCSTVILSTLNSIFKLGLLGFKHNLAVALLISVCIISYRVAIRLILSYEGDRMKVEGSNATINGDKRNLLIIGAGDATKVMIKSIKDYMKDRYNIVGIIDDSKDKIGFKISGVKILGDRNQISEIFKEKQVQDIFFSIANIDSKNKKEILHICQQTKARVRILPSVADIIKNKNLLENLKNVEIDDILGRDPIKLDNENIGSLIKGNTILVTGGGGSIGSELCRQIAKYEPKTLVIFDIYENNAYNIQMELQRNYPTLDLKAIIGSVRDIKKVESVFETYRPTLVFHAAAHKHVPLMEVSPLEAIKNNIFGTYNVVNASDKYNVKKFVLISTDKAVNPTNIMGATKRMCEMIIQTKNKVSKTDYAAVRFGNVLGSNGSVVPLFKEQIEKGGPVTVTHKDIIRYFMTISEAAQLVLQAATYAKGGEIFVLDMGQPVKIYDLAVSMIKLSGYEPEVDIPIKITGLRPGEKLYEELLMGEEGLTRTEHEKIFIGQPLDMDITEIERKLASLRELIQDEHHSYEEIKNKMKKAVPTFHEPKEVNEKVK